MKASLFMIVAGLVAGTGVAMADGDPAAPASGDAAGAPAAPAPATTAPATPAATGGPAAGAKTIGVDVVGVLPLGDYSDAASFAIGAMARFEYAVNEKLSVTARAGYLYHLGTADGASLYIIPIHVGVTYTVAPKIFVWGELGLDVIGASVDVGGTTVSNSDNKFGFAAGAGYKMNKINVRVGFYLPGSEDDGNGGSTTLYGIMGSVGYDFAAL